MECFCIDVHSSRFFSVAGFADHVARISLNWQKSFADHSFGRSIILAGLIPPLFFASVSVRSFALSLCCHYWMTAKTNFLCCVRIYPRFLIIIGGPGSLDRLRKVMDPSSREAATERKATHKKQQQRLPTPITRGRFPRQILCQR